MRSSPNNSVGRRSQCAATSTPIGGHSDYFEPKTESLKNVVRVVRGDIDNLVSFDWGLAVDGTSAHRSRGARRDLTGMSRPRAVCGYDVVEIRSVLGR
ncbi:MAG: hypothetical protein SGJ13_14195 [Actinomycetota bacterium]|nr:hypothetical protein [Actinomycetota bacterium]